jgi:tetratricopeptide (TPR) repeat protein
MVKNRILLPLTISVCVLAVAGCGPHKTPREIEMGSNVEDTPSPTASADAFAGNTANAFPSIALDYPPPGEIPSVDGAETAAVTDPKSATAQLNLGYAYYKEAAYGQAIEYFEKAGKLAPTRPEPLLYSGQSYMGVGDLDKALESLAKASEFKNASPEMRSLAFLQIGNCLFQLKNDPAAKAAFAKSLALNPKQGAAKIALGTYLAMEKETGKAKSLFSAAVKELPSSRIRGKAYASLGFLAEQERKKSDAAASYQKALADDPNNSAAKAGMKRVGK